jgi:hypothetical protein
LRKLTKDGKEEVPQAEAAYRLGITPQALGMWAKRAHAPVILRRGKPICLWPDFPRWRDAERERQIREEGAPPETVDAQLRYEVARAEKMEMEVATMREELVPADLYQRRLEAFVGGFVAIVTGRLGRFERDIVQAATPAAARKVTDAIRNQLLQAGQDYAEQLERQPDDVPETEEAAA